MKKLYSMNRVVYLILGTQEYYEKKVYKRSAYTLSYDVSDGTIYVSTLTRAVILIETGDSEQTAMQSLVRNWIYIPEDIDDYSLVFTINRALLTKTKRTDHAVIFTTTNCNAKCPYCYESSVNRCDMSEDVAADVANWVLRKNPKKFTIRWFGGEPLLNQTAINIISKELRDNEINYTSSMISNGYLFNTVDMTTVTDLWKLTDVQITLDGLAETHDAVKGIDGCFDQTLKNVESLIAAEIKVKLRINFSGGNFDEIVSLADYIKSRFAGKQYLTVYVKSLYGNTNETIQAQTYSLQDYLGKIGIGNSNAKWPRYRRHHCMVDSGHSVVINPEGGLGICEHYPDDIYRTIYDDSKFDVSEYREFWSEPEADKEECKTCFYKPMCKRLLNCDTDDICNQLFLDRMQDRIKAVCMYSYQQYKSKGGE